MLQNYEQNKKLLKISFVDTYSLVVTVYIRLIVYYKNL